jgi:hypothetical protein
MFLIFGNEALESCSFESKKHVQLNIGLGLNDEKSFAIAIEV